MPQLSLQETIWQLVASIPKGKIATYGQIAQLAGHPRHARFVGRTLKNLPKDSTLPWHRVVNGQGKLSFPENSSSHKIQQARLEREGVFLTGNKRSLTKYQWQPH